MIDVPETQDTQCERGRVAVDKGTDDKYSTWCSAEERHVSMGTRFHQQAPIRCEDDVAEVAVESWLLDPADDRYVYMELSLRDLRLQGSQFYGYLPLDTARRLRDQLTEHLDAVR